jgi:hypothetical protein
MILRLARGFINDQAEGKVVAVHPGRSGNSIIISSSSVCVLIQWVRNFPNQFVGTTPDS